MHFLKTLLWVLVAVLVALFAKANWTPVTIKLWNDIVADVQLPVLLLVVFVLAWLPTWLIMRAKIWGLNRRIDALDRSRPEAAQVPSAEETEPVT